MKLLEYILKFGFMIGLSLALIFAVSPAFYNKATNDSVEGNAIDLSRLSLHFDSDSEKYLRIIINTKQGVEYRKGIYVPEGGYDKLISFLHGLELLDKKKWTGQLPISIEAQKLGQVFTLETNKAGAIDSLTTDGQYIIGGSSIFQIGLLYLLSIVFGLLGILAFGLTFMAFRQTYVEYQKTGSFPDLPNSIDSKVEGVKFVFRGFKEKK